PAVDDAPGDVVGRLVLADAGEQPAVATLQAPEGDGDVRRCELRQVHPPVLPQLGWCGRRRGGQPGAPCPRPPSTPSPPPPPPRPRRGRASASPRSPPRPCCSAPTPAWPRWPSRPASAPG